MCQTFNWDKKVPIAHITTFDTYPVFEPKKKIRTEKEIFEAQKKRHPHLRLLHSQVAHVLGIQLDRIVVEFGLGDGLEALAADGQVGVALHPLVAVHVFARAALVVALAVLGEADLSGQAEAVEGGARVHERPVERVAVVARDDVRLHLQDVLEEPFGQTVLVLVLVL